MGSSPASSSDRNEECSRCGARLHPDLAYCSLCGTSMRAARCAAHPSAVAERSCVVCGRALCVRCRHGPRHTALCDEHRGVRLISGWAETYRTSSELEAELAAGILRGAGIEAHVLSQKDSVNVVTFGGLSVLRVLVPAYLLAVAGNTLKAEGIQDTV